MVWFHMTYDQEMTHSHNADQPMESKGTAIVIISVGPITQLRTYVKILVIFKGDHLI